MKTEMDKASVQAWAARWKAVNEFTTREARALTPDQRFNELETMYDFLREIGRLEEDRSVEEVRRRWLRLKEHARHRAAADRRVRPVADGLTIS